MHQIALIPPSSLIQKTKDLKLLIYQRKYSALHLA